MILWLGLPQHEELKSCRNGNVENHWIRVSTSFSYAKSDPDKVAFLSDAYHKEMEVGSISQSM